jgi:hypothetical protein
MRQTGNSNACGERASLRLFEFETRIIHVAAPLLLRDAKPIFRRAQRLQSTNNGNGGECPVAPAVSLCKKKKAVSATACAGQDRTAGRNTEQAGYKSTTRQITKPAQPTRTSGTLISANQH